MISGFYQSAASGNPESFTPAARLSSIKETQILVPFVQGSRNKRSDQ
jgi:hypothetical protein